MRTPVPVALTFAILSAGAAEQPAWPPLEQEDLIVFYGDSITKHGERPHGYVTLFRRDISKKHPDLLLRVLGKGFGHAAVPNLRKLFDREFTGLKPDIVVIENGIADLMKPGADGEVSKKIFTLGMEDLVWRIQRIGARPVMTTLTLVGEKTDGTNPYDPLLEVYSQIIRDVAARKNCRLIELREPFMARLREINPENRDSGVLTPKGDGIHLNEAGNRFLADIFLRAFTGEGPAK